LAEIIFTNDQWNAMRQRLSQDYGNNDLNIVRLELGFSYHTLTRVNQVTWHDWGEYPEEVTTVCLIFESDAAETFFRLRYL
jgi:hypothetical protein